MSPAGHDGARARYEQALALYQAIDAPYSIGWALVRPARLDSADSERARHWTAARQAWATIGRKDLVESVKAGSSSGSPLALPRHTRPACPRRGHQTGICQRQQQRPPACSTCSTRATATAGCRALQGQSVTVTAAGWRSTPRSDDGQTILGAMPTLHSRPCDLHVWSACRDLIPYGSWGVKLVAQKLLMLGRGLRACSSLREHCRSVPPLCVGPSWGNL
jgi:hypothetical protein